jgi:hypothetical protein
MSTRRRWNVAKFKAPSKVRLQVTRKFSEEETNDVPDQTGSGSRVRTYYVAADEFEWDYAPGGFNKMMGMKFEGNSKVFTERGPHRIGTVYRKALYREYTDATFTRLKARAPEWEHAGILGPILRRRSRRHDPCRLQEQRHASLQHAPPWSLL